MHSLAKNICARKIVSPLALLFGRNKNTFIEKAARSRTVICFLKFLSKSEFLLRYTQPVFLMERKINYCLGEFRNGVCCSKEDAEGLNGIE